jgi:hypothetical protein
MARLREEINFEAVLYDRKTWSLTLMECELFERRVLRKISGPKRDEMGIMNRGVFKDAVSTQNM